MWSSKPTKIGRILISDERLVKTIPRVSKSLVTDNLTLSYIAGFLDGDGCINLQLVRRKDYILGYQIRASVTFFQCSSHRSFLEWLKSIFRVGFVRNRKDGLSEYAIVDAPSVLEVLLTLRSYLKLKRPQCDLAITVLQEVVQSRRLTPEQFLKLAQQVDQFSELNASKKRSIRSDQVEQFLRSRQLLIP